jgi:hypothetical protein
MELYKSVSDLGWIAVPGDGDGFSINLAVPALEQARFMELYKSESGAE